MVKRLQHEEDVGTAQSIKSPPDDGRKPGRLFGPSKTARDHQDRGFADRSHNSDRRRNRD